MSKDYKSTDRRHGTRRNGSSLLLGLLAGLVLGLAVALAVAWYINKMPNPFTSRPTPPEKLQAVKPPSTVTAKVDDKSDKPDDKPRFDFYKILPGNDDQAPTKSAKPPQKPAASTTAAKEAFFLQAGAFQNAPDADNMKARLALLGIEANIETAALPDKGVWHRVRAGPYTSVEELNRTRDTLKQNGVQTSLIKVREP